MKLAVNLVFAALLVVASAARCCWSDNTDTIAASADNTKIFALAEASENWKDDKLLGSLALSSALTSPDFSPIPGPVVSQTGEKINAIKDNSRIYKLNSRFLI